MAAQIINFKMEEEIYVGMICKLKKEIEELKKEKEELKQEKEASKLAEEKEKENTKNTKDNRKCVVANYCEPWTVFQIPDGLDLEDKSIVDDWGVRYSTLYINYVDGKEEAIEMEYESEPNYKHPYKTTIEDAEDYSVEYDEDED